MSKINREWDIDFIHTDTHTHSKIKKKKCYTQAHYNIRVHSLFYG